MSHVLLFHLICTVCGGFLLITYVSGNFLYNERALGGIVEANNRIRIDGEPEESWKRNVGESMMFRCITGEKDYPIFLWMKDGKPLTRDVIKYQLISNGNSFLEIPRVSTRSEGNYTCTVSNEFGVARKVFRLCVIAPGKKEDCPGWFYRWK